MLTTEGFRKYTAAADFMANQAMEIGHNIKIQYENGSKTVDSLWLYGF